MFVDRVQQVGAPFVRPELKGLTIEQMTKIQALMESTGTQAMKLELDDDGHLAEGAARMLDEDASIIDGEARVLDEGAG